MKKKHKKKKGGKKNSVHPSESFAHAAEALKSPMLAKVGEAPFDDANWLFEYKWDGYRAIAAVHGNSVYLGSRNRISMAENYPGIVKELHTIHDDVILDGEIVALDKKGVPQFQLLQNYSRNSASRICYYVFDILYLNGEKTIALPLKDRKELLEDFWKNYHFSVLQNSPVTYQKGRAMFRDSAKKGLEGVMAKKSDSRYIPGKRSKNWLKIKVFAGQEAVIGGFTAPQGSRTGFGSILLGVYEKKKLRYTGRCGTGFDDDSLRTLHKKMLELKRKTSPFAGDADGGKDVTWISPELVCEIKYRELTRDKKMRTPVFKGLRTDKDPGDVHLEVPASS